MMSFRKLTSLLFTLSGLFIGISLYLQYHVNLHPCTLCLFQRGMLMVFALLMLIGIVISRLTFLRYVISVSSTIAASLGLALAGRQIWIQHFPPQSTSDCIANFRYMLEVMPLTEIIKKSLIGGPDCAETGYTILTLTLSEWSFFSFALLIIGSLYLIKLSSDQ